ncbi:MAG TPA: hypothetical protein VGP72_11095 [Planctomycetota bacterium]|jgi:hypothetical protein
MHSLIFYSLTEAELFDHRLLDEGLTDVASRGFDGVYLEYRNVRSGCTTPRFKAAVQAFCRKAKARGLGVVVDGNYGRMIDVIRLESPEIFSDSLVPLRLPVKDGCFTIHVDNEVTQYSIEKCYALVPSVKNGAMKLRDITQKLKLVHSVTDGGGCAMTEQKERAIVRLTYRIGTVGRASVPAGGQGRPPYEVFVALRRRFEYSSLDLSHPRLRTYLKRWLATFRGLDVNGFSWDEPHFGFAFWRENGRAISENLYRIFEKRFGYDLRQRLADLWLDQADGRSSLTRIQYSELLEQELAKLESDFAAIAKKRLNGVSDPFVGIHRTMHEETSDDFFIGCCDYFRHNRYTSAGFTDSVFQREDSMVTMLQLARSMGAAKNHTGSQQQTAAARATPAWNNSWGFIPEEKHHALFLRLMGAMQIGWIGHTYHHSHLFGPGYPHHPLWQTLPKHLAAQKKLLNALQGATPVADTAVIYNYRALATFTDNYVHVHRRNLLLLGKALTYANVQFRIVEPEALSSSLFALKSSSSRVQPRAKSQEPRAAPLRRLVVPWPDLLPPGSIEKLAALAASGTEVLIFGPHAFIDFAGDSQSAAFAKLCGIHEVNRNAEMRLKEGASLNCRARSYPLAPKRVQSNYRSNEHGSYPDHFKAYALKPLRGTEVLATASGKPVGVRNGRVTYIATEVPHFPGLPEALVPSHAVPELPGWTLFAYQRFGRALLAGVSRDARLRAAALNMGSYSVTLPTCASFVLEQGARGISVLMREGDV